MAPSHPAEVDLEQLHRPSCAARIDQQLYEVMAAPVSPSFDVAIGRITNLADNSKLSIAMAVGLSLTGRRGRKTALIATASVAVTSAVANLVVKPVARRARPERPDDHINASPGSTNVLIPTSYSFPSGHSAAAFAFATAVWRVWPRAAAIPIAVATTVGYSRIHTGVHYPADVLFGSMLGCAVGFAVPDAFRAIGRLHRP